MTTAEQEKALADRDARKLENEPRVIDNARLRAGAPMYYYCGSCKALVATKPEGWWEDPPPKYCKECQPLADEGLL